MAIECRVGIIEIPIRHMTELITQGPPGRDGVAYVDCGDKLPWPAIVFAPTRLTELVIAKPNYAQWECDLPVGGHRTGKTNLTAQAQRALMVNLQ